LFPFVLQLHQRSPDVRSDSRSVMCICLFYCFKHGKRWFWVVIQGFNKATTIWFALWSVNSQIAAFAAGWREGATGKPVPLCPFPPESRIEPKKGKAQSSNRIRSMYASCSKSIKRRCNSMRRLAFLPRMPPFMRSNSSTMEEKI
jgi:hypothetical protein